MTTSVSQQIPPPKNWQDFELLCADLWARIWKDPDTQMHGRQGQAQHGVDVYGRPDQGQEYAGVQCKGKDGYNNKEVTEAELRGEVEKAKKFEPAIRHFTLATTAPNDVKIQAVAREITEQHQKEDLFDVVVMGWDEIQRRLTDYPELIDKHYPEIGPTQHKTYKAVDRVEASLVTQDERAEQRHQEVLTAIAINALGVPGVGVLQDIESETESKVDEVLNAEIDGYRELLNSHQINTALGLLEKLRGRVWGDASDTIKFRIATNIAAAKSRLGRIEAAASEFIEAAKYNPTDEKAACNVAFGYLLLHEDEKANEAAKKAIEEHPDSSRAYSLLVASLDKDMTVDDPTALIPPEHIEKAEVAYSMSHFFRSRNKNEEANKWIEKALSSDEKSIEVRASAGASLLEPFLENISIAYSGQLTEDQQSQMEKARVLLLSAWNEVKVTDEATQFIHVAANLANLERITNNYPRAREIIDEALRVNPEFDELIRLKIIIELKDDNFEAALSASEKIDINQHQDVIMMQAEALFDLGRLDDALEKVEEVTKDEASSYFDDAIALRLHITRKTKGFDAAITQAKEQLSEYPENIRIACVLYGFYRENKDHENINSILEKVKSLITEETGYRDRKLAADALFYSGNYQDALPIYETLIVIHKDTDELRHMLVCLMELDQRQKIISVFDKLDEITSNTPFYLKMCGAIHQRIGDLNSARTQYSKYLDQLENDLNVRLAWIESCEKLGDKEAIEQFLDEVNEYESAAPEDIVRLAHVLVDYSRVDKGLLLAYENRRKHYDNPAAHFGFMGLLLFKTKQVPNIKEATEIEVDTAFTLQDKAGNKSTYIIESNENRSRQIGELSPEDFISVNAIGKKVGDGVTVSESHIQNEVRKVVSIKKKYLHALHESMEHFQELFPEHKEMTKLSLVDSGDPNEQFAPIFESVSQRQDQILQVEELYITNHLPLAVVAKFTGSHPIDVWRSFMGRQKTQFNVCVGTFEERNKTFEIIEENEVGYAIDPITLFTICILEIQDQVVSVTGKLGITQSTLDLLQQLIDERSVNTEGYLSLSKEGEQFYKHEITQEDIENDIVQIREVLSWAQENCDILPAVGEIDIPLSGLKISEIMAPAFTDTLLAAQGTKRLLLADDMHYRMIASEMFNVKGVWLQPILMLALKRGGITGESYNESIIKIVNSNYNFTSIDANLLLYLAEKENWDANQNFRRLASILNGKHSDFSSSMKVAIEFLTRLWDEPIWVLHKEKFVYMLLNILTEDKWDHVDMIVALLWRSANKINVGPEFIYVTNQTQYKNAIAKWCQGHFIQLN